MSARDQRNPLTTIIEERHDSSLPTLPLVFFVCSSTALRVSEIPPNFSSVCFACSAIVAIWTAWSLSLILMYYTIIWYIGKLLPEVKAL